MSTSGAVEVVEPTEWIIVSSVALIGFVLNARLAIKEWTKRKSEDNDVSFTTNWLKYFSIATLMSGASYALSKLLSYIPITCHITTGLEFNSVSIQAVSMGFYQLSRLYYSFSQNKSHTTRAYSTKWFIFLFASGIFILLNGVLFPWTFGVDNKCYYNASYQLIRHHDPYISYYISYVVSFRWALVMVVLYFLWDHIILGLYARKVCSILKHQQQLEQRKQALDEIAGRIETILQRIFMLTLLYQIPCAFIIISGCVNVFGNFGDAPKITFIIFILLTSVGCNYAVFAMQSHNDEEYKKLLKTWYHMRLYWIFCFCKKPIWKVLDIGGELEMLDSASASNTISSPKSTAEPTGHAGNYRIELGLVVIDDDVGRDRNATIMDTVDHSYKMDHSQIPRTSFDTTMMNTLSAESNEQQHPGHGLKLPRQSTIPTDIPKHQLSAVTEDNHLGIPSEDSVKL